MPNCVGDGLQRGLMVVHALGETGKAASSGRRIVEVVDLPFHGAHLLTQGLNLRPCVGLCGCTRESWLFRRRDLLLLLVQTHLHGVYLAIGTALSERASPKAGGRYTAFSLYYPEMKDLDNKDTAFAGRTQVSEPRRQPNST